MNTQRLPALILRSVPTLALAVLLSHCASTNPKAKFTQSLPAEARIALEDKVSAQVTAGSGVAMLDADRERLAQKIASKVRAAARARGAAGRSYEIAVTITRYDKGSAFARAMLAGLGQIHLDGVITVYQQASPRTKVGEFQLNKTFAWGGIYGMSTTMDTIEDTYADGVAQAVCHTGAQR